MSKDPTPRSDALRVQREARYGHLQATVDAPAGYVDGAKTKNPLPPKGLIPFAGKDRSAAAHGGGIPFSKTPKPGGSPAPRKRVTRKRKIT